MMLFDHSANDNIVIVPPKPDASLCYDECSYSNLYCHGEAGNGCGAPTPAAPAATTVVSTACGNSRANASTGSSSTLSSINERSSSFDASAFDNVRRSSTASSMNSADSAGAPSNSPFTATPSTAITRDPRNGTFTFQVNAEYDLLLHVQKDLDKHRRAAGGNALSDVQLSKIIMRSVDEYCLRKQWMYHIGSEKAVAIGRFLRGGVEGYLKSNGGTGSNGEVKKFVCVDLGTYCGYSALVLASTLREFIQEQQSSMEKQPFEFHIYSTEVSSKLLNVAQSVFRLAKIEKYITPLLVKSDGKEPLSQSLAKHGITNIDFLLLDHAKNLYLNDLQDLENSKLLSAGSHVSADNVVFNRLDSYRNHMHKLMLQGVVKTRLEEMNLEYSNNLKDGLEMTVYLKDPPVAN